MSNTSTILVFSLSGFSATVNYRFTLFALTLLCYCLIVVVNVSLVLTIILDQNLHEPMYMFLCNLCINGLYGTAAFYPKFAFDLLSDVHVISYVGCFLQVFVIYTYATIDFSILALMAYDRYMAICRPLVYHSVMSMRRIAVLISLSWLIPLGCEVAVLTLTSKLTLCGSHIQKLYCENWSIVKLACSSTAANNVVGLIIIAFYCVHVLFIVCTYVRLVNSAMKSKEGRKKFTQTCVPHLLCLVNVTAALLFDTMYSRYGSASVPQNLRNFMAIQFLMMPPILNPIIYGLILSKIRYKLVTLFMKAGQTFTLGLRVWFINLGYCSVRNYHTDLRPVYRVSHFTIPQTGFRCWLYEAIHECENLMYNFIAYIYYMRSNFKEEHVEFRMEW